jgi:DNA-binding CsgD family transcriptional regulator
MPFPLVLYYLLSLSAMVTACVLALGLVKTYRYYFLSSYLGFLVAFNISGLLNLVTSDLFSDMLTGIPSQSLQPIYILFGLVAFPLWAVAFYFYMIFVMGILDEEISPAFRAGYVILWVVLFLGFLTRIQFSLKQTNSAVSRIVNIVLAPVTIAIPIALLAYLMIRAGRGSRAEGKKSLRIFAVVSIVCYILFLAAFFIVQAGPSFRWAVPLCLFAADISPVLSLRNVLRKYGRPIPLETFRDEGINRFRAMFQLSNREVEILDLLLKGKSNKDIERALFVSPHTVRNHVHNIYQKLGVGSRLQLMNFVRAWTESGEESSR